MNLTLNAPRADPFTDGSGQEVLPLYSNGLDAHHMPYYTGPHGELYIGPNPPTNYVKHCP